MRSLITLVGLVLATLLLHLVLIQPNHPGAMTWQALLLFPLELPVIILLLVALPSRAALTIAVRVLLVAFLVVMAVLKSADVALFTAFNRPFNPLVDLNLIEAGIRLLAGTIGTLQTSLVVVGAIIAPFVLAAALWWATGQWAHIALPLSFRALAGFAAVIAAGVAVAEIGEARGRWTLPVEPPGAAFTARVALERTTTYNRLFTQLSEFRQAAAQDPFADVERPLDALGGRDTVFVFVESYGRASFDNSLYSQTHLATLGTAESKLEQAGVEARSGWLTAPISGGQSWLAHGTLASGMRTSNQALYTAMLASGRKTLWDYAAAAGYETAAVMPAITLPWPEADLLGFEHVYPAKNLGYRGEPFNWVTMPDQFTLTAFDRLFEDQQSPLFAQIALISSHAPWVPVPELIAWEAVGDGTVFNAVAKSGDPPSVVWRDPDRIRDQYRLSIDYSLETIFDYVARSPQSKDRLTIILGDHPPTIMVAGIEGYDIPIHIVGPEDLINATDDWQWTEGLIPGSDVDALADGVVSRPVS
ncbi:hypothetical protein GCM10007989_31360 [Devosia pacifica]|uniref:Sulfatase N-terminal domain-containing protein n=2 Tax=Devosia pacifica TaxID=1335967 RepID=A0A918SAH8_9HYPH|nr:hypothetical protein GCM10007989_31360 [Devosia pacifica]